MSTQPVKVWDPLIRITHWSFAGLVLAMWYTAENKLWFWHTRLGIVLLALLVFRVIWGFVGTHTARFSNFVKGPQTVIAYLRGQSDHHIGHNPLGGWAVLALLAVLFAQVCMGLFAGDPYDGATGPLNAAVGVGIADMLTDWHEDFLYVVLGLAGVHVLAIAFYAAIKTEDLISPMLSGQREAPPSVEGIGAMPWGRATLAVAIAAGFALWVWSGAPPLT